MTSNVSLTAIRAFDAVSRNKSFKRAAEELGVTATAISHQIRQLETSAGVQLFYRDPKGVSHTQSGAAFAHDIGQAFDNINRAYEKLVNSGARASVVLGAGPIVASRWLAPMLPDFAARHPQIDLQLINSPTEIWRRVREFDLAIAWGRGNWRGLHATKLLSVSLVPVLAPRLASELGGIESPTDLLRAPLLHHRQTMEWANWFRAAKIDAPVPPGTLFEDTNVGVQAALAGTGVLLGIREFLADDVASKRLISPFEIALQPESAYYLVSERSPDSAAISALMAWLEEKAGISKAASSN